MYKICTCCGKEKKIDEFYKDAYGHGLYGRRSQCKECCNKKNKERANRRKPKPIKHKICAKCKMEKSVEHFHNTKYSADGYRYLCKDCSNEEKKIWACENQEHVKKYKLNYVQENNEAINNARRKRWKSFYKDKKENDTFWVFKRKIKNNIRTSFNKKGYNKNRQIALHILGCKTWDFFYDYIESFFHFHEGMTWDNMNLWELDHVVPLSTAKTEEDVVRLCHYTNYQPLWTEDNKKKSNKILEGIQLIII